MSRASAIVLYDAGLDPSRLLKPKFDLRYRAGVVMERLEIRRVLSAGVVAGAVANVPLIHPVAIIAQGADPAPVDPAPVDAPANGGTQDATGAPPTDTGTGTVDPGTPDQNGAPMPIDNSGDPGTVDTGTTDPNGDPTTTDPGTVDTGTTDPNGDPTSTDPGTVDTGTTDPGTITVTDPSGNGTTTDGSTDPNAGQGTDPTTDPNAIQWPDGWAWTLDRDPTPADVQNLLAGNTAGWVQVNNFGGLNDGTQDGGTVDGTGDGTTDPGAGNTDGGTVDPVLLDQGNINLVYTTGDAVQQGGVFQPLAAGGVIRYSLPGQGMLNDPHALAATAAGPSATASGQNTAGASTQSAAGVAIPAAPATSAPAIEAIAATLLKKPTDLIGQNQENVLV